MPTTGMKRDTALFGGSFDPVHRGHMHLVHEAFVLTGIKRVIFIPSFVSNFKRGGANASFPDRYKMLELAILDYRDEYGDGPELLISDVEEKRGGISYTSDTVRYFLSKECGEGRISFIMGDDLLDGIERWHDYQFLKEHVHFIVFSRNGLKNVPEGLDATLFRSEVFDASSTDVRNGDFSLLTPRVLKYVSDRGLYDA